MHKFVGFVTVGSILDLVFEKDVEKCFLTTLLFTNREGGLLAKVRVIS